MIPWSLSLHHAAKTQIRINAEVQINVSSKTCLAAHAVSQSSVVHSEERAICPLPHTWVHGCQQLASIIVIDKVECVCHPSYLARFARLAVSHRWLRYCWDWNLCLYSVNSVILHMIFLDIFAIWQKNKQNIIKAWIMHNGVMDTSRKPLSHGQILGKVILLYTYPMIWLL